MKQPPAEVVAALEGADDETLNATIAYCEAELAADEPEEPEDADPERPEAFEGDDEQWETAVEDVDAPTRATVTVKTINDNQYLYYQWSEDGKTKSEYIAPVNPKR